jgi:hypothetical protein
MARRSNDFRALPYTARASVYQPAFPRREEHRPLPRNDGNTWAPAPTEVARCIVKASNVRGFTTSMRKSILCRTEEPARSFCQFCVAPEQNARATPPLHLSQRFCSGRHRVGSLGPRDSGRHGLGSFLIGSRYAGRHEVRSPRARCAGCHSIRSLWTGCAGCHRHRPFLVEPRYTGCRDVRSLSPRMLFV